MMAVLALLSGAALVLFVVVLVQILREGDLMGEVGTARAGIPAFLAVPALLLGIAVVGRMLLDLLRYGWEVLTGARPRLREPGRRRPE